MRTATNADLVTVAAPGTDLKAVRRLFVEYAEALGFSLCFQGFDKELETLPGDYAPPGGRLLLANEGEESVGCIGLRPLDAERCEIKRLYVRPVYRGKGLGRRLTESAIAAARKIGYRRVLLDTLPTMREARALYASLGFTVCAPCYDNTCASSDCFELKL